LNKLHFVVRQRAMHTERDIVLANPSVRHTVILHISSNSVSGMTLVFERNRPYKIPRGTHSALGR